MPSSAAAAEGEEEGEGDALDVSSSSLSLAFLREDMFKKSSNGFVLKKYGDFAGSNPLVAFASDSKQKVHATYNEFERSNITLALGRRKYKRRRRKR